MDFLTHLWLPILLSAAAVWFISALCWMAIGHHNKDTQGLPNEDAFINFIKTQGIKPGNYGFPDFQKCKTLTKEERAAQVEAMRGGAPMGLLNVWAPFNMARNMILTFVTCLVVSVLIAYLGAAAMGWNQPFAKVFQVTGTAGILAYCFASIPNDIWFQKSPRAMLTCFIDGAVFGLATGAIFAAMWPK